MRGTEGNVLKFGFTIFTLPKTIEDIIFHLESYTSWYINSFQFSVLPIMHFVAL